MPELMLRPDWPSDFRRLVQSGDGQKPLVFTRGTPVTVTDDELLQLLPDIGVVVFEVARDEKGRPRFVESELMTNDQNAG